MNTSPLLALHNNHAKAVEKYKLEIIDGGKKALDRMDIENYT